LKPAPFRYFRAKTLAEAIAAYAQAEGDCCYMAGGQSLIPALSLRLQAPSLVIDISRLEELRGISSEGDTLRIGALTRHNETLHSPEIAKHAPLLSKTAPYVAHPAIRNKGTLGGTIAHADPAAEFPAIMLALDAEFEIAGPEGTRLEKANGFFRGLYETALNPGEILVAVRVPVSGTFDRCAYHEFARRRGDYPLVGCGVRATVRDGIATNVRFTFVAVGPVPQRAFAAEAAVEGKRFDEVAIASAQAALCQDLHPDDDGETSATMRVHLARVLLGRLLRDLAGIAPMRTGEAA
jgi:carbon-monoxide dehydrogenase medium subunit